MPKLLLARHWLPRRALVKAFWSLAAQSIATMVSRWRSSRVSRFGGKAPDHSPRLTHSALTARSVTNRLRRLCRNDSARFVGMTNPASSKHLKTLGRVKGIEPLILSLKGYTVKWPDSQIQTRI